MNVRKYLVFLIVIFVSVSSYATTLTPGVKVNSFVSQGSCIYYEFPKYAGCKYTVVVKSNSGNADLYGHWTSSVSTTTKQFWSENTGLSYDYISFESTQTGVYYIAVNGKANSFYSIYYVQNSTGIPWQLNNQLVSPLGGTRQLTSSGYGPFGSVWGNEDQDPFISGYNDYFHVGVDWIANYGDPVYAVADGIVKKVGNWGTNWGYYVTVEHNVNGYVFTAVYGHLQSSGLPSSTSPNNVVYAGDQIGTICQVNVLGEVNHLHFTLHPGSARKLDQNAGMISRSHAGAVPYYIFPQDFFNAGNVNLYQ